MKNLKQIVPSSYFIIVFLIFSCNDQQKTNQLKYQHYVGYIDQEKALLNNGVLCDKENIKLTHHGPALLAFEGNKKRFKNFILSKYRHQLYKDSGYISFRFLVNCKGEAGWFTISEMNLNLEKTDLNDDMVNELLSLTSKKENWNILSYNDNVAIDYYMYIIYRIENGKVTEILP